MQAIETCELAQEAPEWGTRISGKPPGLHRARRMRAVAAGRREAKPCGGGPHPAWFLTRATNQEELAYTKLLTLPWDIYSIDSSFRLSPELCAPIKARTKHFIHLSLVSLRDCRFSNFLHKPNRTWSSNTSLHVTNTDFLLRRPLLQPSPLQSKA